MKTDTKSTDLFIENDYDEIDIDEILEISSEKKLIDISIEEDETFCITNQGIISHNCKSMLRAITHLASRSNTPIIFANHIYEDPSQLHMSSLKKQAGGSGPLYLSSVVVQLAKKTEKSTESKNKDSDTSVTPLSKAINGLTLRALTTKNRFTIPFLETEMYLNFKTGLAKYSGLLEMAESYDVIQKQGHRYVFQGEMLGFFKDWKNDPSIWDKILPSLDEILKKELCFRNEANPETLVDEPDEDIYDIDGVEDESEDEISEEDLDSSDKE